MACDTARFVDYVTPGVRSDLPAIITVSRSVSLRVVRIQVFDAVPARDRQEDRSPLPAHRLTLPMAIARVAVPVAAAGLALAAAPLLRRLPDRLLPLGAASHVQPVLPGTMERAVRMHHSSAPLPIAAGEAVMSISTAGGAVERPTGERAPRATACIPS